MERRKHQRHLLSNGSIVIHGESLGSIKDISQGGFCCSCLIDGDHLTPKQDVNIIRYGINFKASNLPIDIRSTYVEQGVILESMVTRVCHIAFKELSNLQQKQIDSLIHSYAEEAH